MSILQSDDALIGEMYEVLSSAESFASRNRTDLTSDNIIDAIMQLRAKLITERPSPGSYSAAQLMAVFENALDAVIVIDEKGVISFFNASAVRMFGYSAREVVGQNVKILMPSPDSERHDDYLARFLQTRKAKVIGIGRNVTARNKDGSTFPVHLSLSPARVGAVEMFAGFIRQIRQPSLDSSNANIDESMGELVRDASANASWTTRHSESQAEALAQLELMKVALDKHSIVAITDPAGRITHANDNFCQISQYSREELIGASHRIINSGYHPRSFFAEMWNTIASGNTWHGEVCNKAKDGSVYWVDTTVVPFKDDVGRITQYVAIRTDITARKQQHIELSNAKEAAMKASAAKSTFLANMSHEIRTPMTAILGFAEAMLDSGQEASTKLNAAHTIHRNGEHLLQIINDILDIAKIEAGKLEVQCTRFSPVQLVAEVIALMQVRASAKSLPLNIEFVGSVPETIESDPTRLKQILVNLIGNAIKFTDGGGVRLIIRFVDDAKHARAGSSMEPTMQFEVLDTGLGMTEEQIGKLFQPFSQVDAAIGPRLGGTGLGLSISKRLAQMLGGDITVESKPGEGSLFRVSVTTGSLQSVQMLDDPTSTMIVQPETRPTAMDDTDKLDCRILLVEDSQDNQRLISYILKRAGARVTIAENGKVAVDAVLAARNGRQEGDLSCPFDIILMDMQMPVMDGYEATEQLRREGYTGPIIALTANAMAGDRRKCIQSGCDEYASKPIDRTKLFETIREQLRQVANPIDA